MLLGAHEGAGTADLEVAHGDAHAAPQVLVLVDGREAIGRLGRERLVGREHEVGVRLLPPAPHATLELVELCEAQALRILDDECVGVRVVDAALDDGGGHEYVDLVLREL